MPIRTPRIEKGKTGEDVFGIGKRFFFQMFVATRDIGCGGEREDDDAWMCVCVYVCAVR
jgi:hypothetical protein